MDLRQHAVDGLVDAGVHTEGEAVAGAVDVADQRFEIVTLVAQHVQHGTEDFAAQVLDAPDLDERGRHVGAGGHGLMVGACAGGLADAMALGAHRVDVLDDVVACLGVDHGAHVGGQHAGVALTQLAGGAFQHGQHAIGAVFLHAQHAQGRAALAGRVEGRDQHVLHHLFGQRGGVHDHRVLATGLGDQRDGVTLAVQALGQGGGNEACHFGGAGEHDGRNARIGHQRGAHLHAVARQQLQHVGRDAGLVQDAHGFGGNQRRLLGRLGDDRVAGSQCGRDLTGEDGQREVPRADAQHRTQRLVGVVPELGRHLVGVVAQEVHGLADLGDGVGQRLAGFADHQTHQDRHAVFHQLGGALQAGGAVSRGDVLPGLRGGFGRLQRSLDVGRRGFHHVAHHVLVIGRVEHGLGILGQLDALAGGGGRAVAGLGQPGLLRAGQKACRQGGQLLLVGQVDARGVGALAEDFGGVQVDRQRDTVVRGAHRRDGGRFLDRVGDQLVDRQRRIADAVDEGGVGAVFQQAPHQVGQERLIGAHRGVDAARPAQAAFGDGLGDLLVERFTHAVQALEFVLAGVVVPAGQFVDGGQCLRVVRGEHRVDGVGHFQQFAGADLVGHVGVHLAGVDRVAVHAVELGALDLAVPVGPLDQADHQPVVAAAGQVDHVVDDVRAALLVGLDHEADAVPAGQRRVKAQRLQQVQRDLQPVGFLGVDVERDVVLAAEQGQLAHAGQQLGLHAIDLGTAVARVQGRELDGDAGALVDAAAGRGLADGVDGHLVGGHVGLGVGFGGGGLAQHVVGVAEPLGLVLAGVGQRFLDGLAGDELLAHHPHAQVHALAHQRLATLLEDAGECRGELVLAAGAHQPAGDDQAPGGGIDEDGRGLAHVGLPVAVADLVTDERIARLAVGNAQQRLGQAHQRHAFLAGEREFLDQRLDAAGTRPGTQPFAQAAGQLVHARLEARVGQRGVLGLGQQPGDTFGFGAAPGGRDGGTARGLRRHLLGKGHEGGRGLALGALGQLGRIGAGRGQLVGRLLTTFDGFQIADQRLSGQPLKTAIVAVRNVLQAIVQCFVDLDVERGRAHVSCLRCAGIHGWAATCRCRQGCRTRGSARSPPDPVQPVLGVRTANPASKNGSVSFFLRNILVSHIP